MPTVKKTLFWSGLILIVVLVAVATAAWIALDSRGVGQTLLSWASEASGLQLRASSIHLGVFSGIELRDVSASGEYARGDYTIHADRVLFRQRWAPLLRGEIVVDQVAIDKPNVEIVVRKPETEGGSSEGKEGAASLDSLPDSLKLEVHEISINAGTVLVREELPREDARQNVRLDQVGLVLSDIVLDGSAPKPIDRLAGRGEIDISQAQLGRLSFRNIRGEVRLQKGVLSSDRLSLSSDEGDLEATLSADFNSQPFSYRLTAKASPLNLNEMVNLEKDPVLGPGHLQFEGQGRGTSPEGLVGHGVLHLDPGKIPQQPILTATEKVLGMSGLVGGEYEATEAHFKIAEGRVTIDEFSLKSQNAEVSLGGVVDLDGPIQLQVRLEGKADEMSVPGVPPQVLQALANQQGWVTVPLKVTGTREDPRVEPDAEALLSQAGNRFMRFLGGSKALEGLLQPKRNP